MRGKVRHFAGNCRNNGITPAYAGKRRFAPVPESTTKDHPRLCGEKRHFSPSFVLGFRITPAYAGKRNTCVRGTHDQKDHPRLCGEKAFDHLRRKRHRGSPPPMRGKDRRIRRFFPNSRITPAYAGKSRRFRSCHCREQDHPRLCGEKDNLNADVITATGSPPPMRGKVNRFVIVVQPRRITPAYAGKSAPQLGQ